MSPVLKVLAIIAAAEILLFGIVGGVTGLQECRQAAVISGEVSCP